MGKDEKVIINSNVFSRELLEKVHANIKKNEAAREAAKKLKK